MFTFNKTIKNISLDALLLFILVVMTANSLLGSLAFNTSLVFYLVSFILLFIYLLLPVICKKAEHLYLYKLAIILFLIVWLVIIFIVSQIYIQHTYGDYTGVHDGIIQMEEAIKYFVQGQNPYSLDYFGTTLEKLWDGKIGTSYGVILQNPALYHFIALPFQLIFSSLLYLLSIFSIGWFDQRFVYLLMFLASLVVIYKIPKGYKNKLLYLIIFAFNPLFVPYFVEGTNDIFVFFWIILSIYLLKINKVKWSSLVLAFAILSKHSAWFLAPFYFLYLWLKNHHISSIDRTKKIIKETWPFWLALLIILVPFLIWDFNAFIMDTFQYPAGTLPTSYPINGWGFSVFLLIIGVIRTPFDYFPFWIIQFIVGLPVLYFLIKAQIKNNTLSQVIFNFGLLAFTFWLFSRFFHNNYIGFLSMLFISAYFLDQPDN